MNFNLLIISLSLIVTVNSIIVQDYCEPELCDTNDGNIYNHIGCNNTGELAENCSSDAHLIPIDYDLIKLILKTVNQMRNKIANGDIDDYEPAEKMPTMLWDHELAYLAELHVKTCERENDECRNTRRCQYAGQIVDVSYINSEQINLNDEIFALIHSWFNEYTHANNSIISQYIEPDTDGYSYKRFTILVNQKINNMGCAVSSYTSTRRDKLRKTLQFTCNFSFTNIADESVYKVGSPCSACLSGCNDEFKALCDPHEYVKNIPDSLLNSE